MRHLWSLLAGVLIAPLAWLTMCIGQVGTARQFDHQADTGHFVAGDFTPPLLFLAGAGLILGVIATLRLSPLGPLVAGLAYLASYVALIFWPERTYDTFGYTFHLSFLDGQGNGDLTTPLTTGTAPVLGALLLVAVVSAKRWRRWPGPLAAGPVVEPVAPPAPVSPAAITAGPASTDTSAVAGPATTDTMPVVPQQAGSPEPFVETEPIGTVVWTREPAETTVRQPSASAGLPVAGAQPGGYATGARGGSPWDTPPGEGTDRSSTR